MSATSPIRHPGAATPDAMRTRAFWLVGLGILIPGSAQLLAGDRRLGRFAVAVTFGFWIAIIVALGLYLVWRPGFLALATNIIALTIVQVLLAGIALLWIVLAIDTLRLAQLVRIDGLGRALVASLAVVALVGSVALVGYGASVAGSARAALVEIFGNGDYAEPIDGRYNIMLLGGDAGPDRLGLRPDSITVVSVDADTGAATMIGVPRNLENVPFVDGSPMYGPYPNGWDCGNDCLISYLYTYGQQHPELYPDAAANGSDPGVEAVRDSVEAVTGLEMQYYVLIDMQGFSDLIDALGGVSVDVPTRVELGENGHPAIGAIEAGEQTMDGATALWYARTRYNTTDYDRMARQRLVQQAILAQFEPANVLTKFQAVATAGAQVVKTDIPSGMLPRLVDLAGKARSLPITTLELVPPTIVTATPDIELIHSLVRDILSKESAG